MKLYRVTSNGSGYDEYDDVIVRAESAQRAREMVVAGYDQLSGFAAHKGKPLPGFESWRDIEVEELSFEGPEEFLTTSFHAG